MFERFTDTARRVTVLAQEEARNLNHNYIGTEHILLGLLSVESGAAREVLTIFNFRLDLVRDEVVRIIGQGQQKPSGHIPFTPRAKTVLELSLREALQLDHNYIGTEHLLLGIIREGKGVAAQILEYADDKLPRIRQEVIRLLSVGVSDEPDVKEADPRQPGPASPPDLTLGEHIAEFVDLDIPASQYENVEISWASHKNDRRAGYLTVCIHCGRTLDFGT